MVDNGGVSTTGSRVILKAFSVFRIPGALRMSAPRSSPGWNIEFEVPAEQPAH